MEPLTSKCVWILLLALQVFRQVVVADPSWRTTPPREVYTLPGDNVTLPWVYDLDGGDIERITWGILSNNIMVQTMARKLPNQTVEVIASFVGKVEIQGVGTIVIKNVTSSDSNVYGCLVDTSTSFSMFGSTTLTVLGQLPVIQSNMPDVQTVVEGAGVFTAEAIIESDPGIKLSWFKDDLGVPSRYIVTTQVIGMTPEGKSIFKTVLRINNVTANDLGNFSLIGGFGDTVAYAVRVSTFLNVQYGPRNLIFKPLPYIDVVTGRPVNLSCSANSNPPSSMVITKSGGARLNAVDVPWYFIGVTKETDTGNYECTASNGIGNSQSAALVLQVSDSGIGDKLTEPNDDKDWMYYLIAGLLLLIFLIILILIIRWRKRTIRKRTISQRQADVVGKTNEAAESTSASMENLGRTNGTNGVAQRNNR